MRFVKMHGLGNDFIIVNCLEHEMENPGETAKKVCKRRFGIGADGLILVMPSDKADYMMRVFNADGSEAEMCGNGIRCFAKYLKDRDMAGKAMAVETLAGIIKPEITDKGVRVDMGKARLKREEIPMEGPSGKVVDEDFNVLGKTFKVTCVSMGNPHCVIFVEDVENFEVEKYGQAIEKDKRFPKKTNVEFVEVKDSGHIKVRVFERGVGETLACGTGACASAVAGVLNKKTGKEVTVELPGGKLFIDYKDNVYMTGPAEEVCEGERK